MPLAAPNADELAWVTFAVIALTILLLFVCRRWLMAGLRWCFASRKVKIKPLQQAHAELEAMRLQTDSVCFADGMIRCLRRYLKNEYSIGLDSYSQTELRSAIVKQLDLENQVELDLAVLFEQCEQAKFSQQTLDSHSRDTLQKQAKALLGQLAPATSGSEK